MFQRMIRVADREHPQTGFLLALHIAYPQPGAQSSMSPIPARSTLPASSTPPESPRKSPSRATNSPIANFHPMLMIVMVHNRRPRPWQSQILENIHWHASTKYRRHPPSRQYPRQYPRGDSSRQFYFHCALREPLSLLMMLAQSRKLRFRRSAIQRFHR